MKNYHFFGGLLLVLLVSGCSRDQDISGKLVCWGELSSNNHYSVATDLFVIRAKDVGPLKVSALTPPEKIKQLAGLFRAPSTIQDYKINNKNIKYDYVQDVIKKDTAIKITQLWLTEGWNPLVGAYKNLSVYALLEGVEGVFNVTDLVFRDVDNTNECGVKIRLDSRLINDQWGQYEPPPV